MRLARTIVATVRFQCLWTADPYPFERMGSSTSSILNSEYYAQTLSASTIKSLYGRFRSLLVHNAALAPGSFLVSFSGQHVSFPVSDDRQCVNLPPFLELSKRAVGVFLERLDTVVPRSDQARNLSMKQRLTGHLTTGSG